MEANQIEELVNGLKTVLEIDEEVLASSKELILNNLTETILGQQGMAAIDEYLKQADLMGYSLDQYQKDLEASQAMLYELMMGMKNDYPDSEVKQEIIDMIYGLMETYFSMIAMRVASRDSTNIGVELAHPNAKLPVYMHEGDQGADVYAVEDTVIEPHTFGTMVPTGLKLLIPQGWAISIRPRSGLSHRTPLRISNSPATIDQQYRGEVKILFDNFSDKPIEIKAGDRIAQFVLEKNHQANYSKVDTVEPNTDRGEGGFGSSGN